MKNSRLCPCLATFMALIWLLALPASARPELCEDATQHAARETGVPVDVLAAIALTETGRRMAGQMRPWPWAGNIDGQGFWFDTREEAIDFARSNLARGRQSFDLGCFQINWRWHGEHFSSPQDLLDPLVSARYAASFLSDLYAELGDWEAAAGAYHSRTPHFANRYRARFAQLRAALGTLPPLSADAPAPFAARAERPVRVNTYPLLQAAADTPATRTASLFAAPAAGAAPFLQNRSQPLLQESLE